MVEMDFGGDGSSSNKQAVTEAAGQSQTSSLLQSDPFGTAGTDTNLCVQMASGVPSCGLLGIILQLSPALSPDFAEAGPCVSSASTYWGRPKRIVCR